MDARVCLLISSLMSVSYFVGACASPDQTPIALRSIVGLWRYPNHAVWIKVAPDGSLFQCRRPTAGPVIVSRGHFAPPSSFVWDQNWGTERIEIAGTMLVVHSTFGAFHYERPDVPMGLECAAAAKANGS